MVDIDNADEYQLSLFPPTNAKTERVVALLEATKATLLEHGWQQHAFGQFHNETGTVCLLGAVLRVRYQFYNEAKVNELIGGWLIPLSDAIFATDRSAQAACDALQDAICRRDGGTDASVSEWNDEQGRTFIEVIELVDETIISLKESQTENI